MKKNGRMNKHRHVRSQVELKLDPHGSPSEKYIQKDDTLSSISQISQVDDARGDLPNTKTNESREDYVQALGTLTQRHKLPKPKCGKKYDTTIGSKLLPSKLSKHNRNYSKQVKSLKKTLETSKSNFVLPNLNSRLQNKKPSLTRTKNITFKFNQEKEIGATIKAYALPETKYDADTIQDIRIQYLIVFNEVSCLLEKAKMLQNEQIGSVMYHLKKVTLNTQRNFNHKFEKLCGMIIQISLIILQEFGKDPESIGIEDITYLLHQTEVVTDEIKNCEANFSMLGKVITFLADSREAYTIISSSSDRTNAKPTEILKLLSLISRARFYCSEITERIRLMERNTLIKKRELQKKSKPKLKLDIHDTIPENDVIRNARGILNVFTQIVKSLVDNEALYYEIPNNGTISSIFNVFLAFALTYKLLLWYIYSIALLCI